MPNWCYNSLNLDGSDEAIDEFHRQFSFDCYKGEYDKETNLSRKYKECEVDLKVEVLSMRESANLIKISGDVDEPAKKLYLNNFLEVESEESPYNTWGVVSCGDKGNYVFETAWGPPEPVVDAMSNQYPELIMEYIYDEVGMQFCGRKDYIEGECTSQVTEGDYDDYTWACIDIMDYDEYFICSECGSISLYEDECYECETDTMQCIQVGSEEDIRPNK